MMGPGAHEMVGPEALKMGFKKTLLMSSGLRGTDIVHNMAESLKWHGLEVVVYDQVESNPKDYNVMDSVKLYQQNECDSFISIGGGSTHDACKGARISVAHDGRNVNDFEGFNMSAAEAALLGRPLVLSDIPVHREVFSDLALLLSAESAEVPVDKLLAYVKAALAAPPDASRLSQRVAPATVAREYVAFIDSV
jgi:hypothetical protein